MYFTEMCFPHLSVILATSLPAQEVVHSTVQQQQQGERSQRRFDERARNRMGMAGMLSSLGLTLEGRHHSGIDDCRNIARIAKELCRRSRCVCVM